MITFYEYLKNNNFDFKSLINKNISLGLKGLTQYKGTIIAVTDKYITINWENGLTSWENTYEANDMIYFKHKDQYYWVDTDNAEKEIEKLKDIKIKESLYNELLSNKDKLSELGIYL
jgi:hypothetical protein